MNKSKIFKHNLKNNSKIIKFNSRKNEIGYAKYLPSFSKEWVNTIYSFDKKTLSNIPTFTQNVNKIIKSYFDLFFKNRKFIDMPKFILLKRRRNFLRRIFTSNAEIKHTNNKIIITLYVLNREKNVLKKKYLKINNIVNKNLLGQFFSLYIKNLKKIHRIYVWLNTKYKFMPSIIRKNIYLKSKIENLNKLKKVKHIFLIKIWSKLIDHYLNLHLSKLRKYSLLYSLNTFKFNKLTMLSILSNILNKIKILKNKKIEYNIVSLKYLTNNPDLFTNILALKLKRFKRIQRLKQISKILNRTHLPIVNTIQERTYVKRGLDVYKNRYKNLKIISYLKNKNLDKFLNSIADKKTKNISNNIYNSIKYKNLGGIRIEIKGRLSKRYRADRSVYSLRWKGGLKNIESSFQRIGTTLLRGNVKSNTAYSISPSKRRIGAFAVKGWIAGK
jgi:hypothetical protein